MSRILSFCRICFFICPVMCLFCCNRMLLVNDKHFVNPLQFGLTKAKTGVERYYVLQRTHNEAYRRGKEVSYSGIKNVQLEIPKDAKSLPLTHYTDFAGVSFEVKNTQKDFYLFTLSNKMASVSVKGREIDSRDFTENPTLKSGRKLLVITDDTPWVETRSGYSQGATRKDIMLLINGKGENDPVQSYCTQLSSPKCYYCEVGTKEKVIKNVKFIRTKDSTKKTYLIEVENQNNIELSNISITTPNGSGMNADRAIRLKNCYDVSINEVSIDGTYSLPKKYGYGISMNNVCLLNINNMVARANWGVFGNNNVQKAMLKNCDINRFDIHCYGRDISFEDCVFVDIYNQFSSIYGLLSFRNCTFKDFFPILMEYSYNAYTAYDVLFNNCTFTLDKNHNCIVYYPNFCQTENSRPELRKKCLPNVLMLNCRIEAVDGLKKWYVFGVKDTDGYEGEFCHVSNVTIEGLSTNCEIDMAVFNKSIKTEKEVLVVND